MYVCRGTSRVKRDQYIGHGFAYLAATRACAREAAPPAAAGTERVCADHGPSAAGTEGQWGTEPDPLYPTPPASRWSARRALNHPYLRGCN